MINNTEICDRGMNALVKELGAVETEYFITFIKQDTFDYTKWRSNQFDDMTIAEISDRASNLKVNHSFSQKTEII